MKYLKLLPEKILEEIYDFNDVTHFKSEINYTYIFLENGKYQVFSYTLKRFEEMLNLVDQEFVRIHKSYIVNKAFIESNNREEVLLKNGLILPISRRRKGILF